MTNVGPRGTAGVVHKPEGQRFDPRLLGQDTEPMLVLRYVIGCVWMISLQKACMNVCVKGFECDKINQ